MCIFLVNQLKYHCMAISYFLLESGLSSKKYVKIKKKKKIKFQNKTTTIKNPPLTRINHIHASHFLSERAAPHFLANLLAVHVIVTEELHITA